MSAKSGENGRGLNPAAPLTARQVADLLGVSPETVLRYTRAGELGGIRLPGTARGRLRYRPEEVEAWLEARATAGPANRESPDTGRTEPAEGEPMTG